MHSETKFIIFHEHQRKISKSCFLCCRILTELKHFKQLAQDSPVKEESEVQRNNNTEDFLINLSSTCLKQIKAAKSRGLVLVSILMCLKMFFSSECNCLLKDVDALGVTLLLFVLLLNVPSLLKSLSVHNEPANVSDGRGK